MQKKTPDAQVGGFVGIENLLSDFANALANVRERMLANAEGQFIMLVRGCDALL